MQELNQPNLSIKGKKIQELILEAYEPNYGSKNEEPHSNTNLIIYKIKERFTSNNYDFILACLIQQGMHNTQ